MRTAFLFLISMLFSCAAMASPSDPDVRTSDPDKLVQEIPNENTRYIQKLFASTPSVEVKEVTAKPKLQKGTEAYHYRTEIREQTQIAKANFAGEWVLVTIGCGTGCTQYFLMHAQTGEVVAPRLMTVSGFPLFQADKPLLVTGGSVEIDTVQEAKEHGVWGGPKAWEWKRQRFTPVPLK